MSRFGKLEFDTECERQAETSAPTKDEAYYLAGAREEFERAEFEQALRWFAKALEFNPQNPVAWVGQVRALIELGEVREAVLWANKALERFPREPELLAAKAVALARNGEFDDALAFSDASIEERGDAPYLWLARGDVLLAREESRADYCFDKALALAPGDWVIAWLAARIRHYYQHFVAAMKLLEQALEWNTTHFLLWLELGRCQLALGLAGPAKHSFRQARQLNPQCSEAERGLGRAEATGLGAKLSGVWRRLVHP